MNKRKIDCENLMKTHLNSFGASKINTTVLPILNWPSSSPLANFVSAGNLISS